MGLIYNKDEEKWYLEDGTVLGGDEEDENGYDRVSEYQTLVDMGVIQDNIGQYGKGNIDLYNRPQVKNNDGTTSTVRSMAFEEDGQHILVPTVGDNGNIMSDEEAIEAYHNSGNYLGKFTTADEADEYAQALHTQQETFMNFDEPASFTDADYEKDTNKFGQPYQKLTVGETLQDMGAALGTEILDILRPKKGGAADKLLPDWIPREIEYAAKTHAAENTAFLYRGISGLLGFAAPMGWAKGAIYAPKAVKGLKGLQALLQSNKSQGVLAKVGMALFTPVEAQSKLGKFLAAAPELIGATLASEFVLSRPEEQEQTIGDMYPDAPFADSLKTDSNDSLLTAKAKLALGNSAIGIATGPFLSLVLNPLMKGGIKAWAKYIKNPDDTAAKAAVDAVKAQSQNVAKETDIINNLSSIKEQAKAAVDEERYIKDYAREKGYDPDSAWEIYKHLDEGKSIIPNADGSYSIHIEKWQDAADVSLEELKAQTGNDGVELMNETVKDTWRERGLLTDPEGDLFNHNSQQEIVPGNKNTKNIVNYYKDKWDLGNSKIEVQYGDWEAIPNGRTSVQDGKVIIQINKNTQNPYAVLRSELEHTRDTVKGEVPNQGERHFSRYEGKNESEMSLSYVKKKADTRGYTYLTGQETINGMPTGVKQLKNKAGKVLAEVRYIDSRNSYRIRMDNYGIQKGAARKALAELMKEYPDKNFYWEAINEQSIKSYQHFIKEYPELAKRIRFENTVEAYNNLAEFHHNLYNYDKAKGDVNETQLSGSEREGSSEALRNNNSSSNTGLEEVSGEQSGDIRQPGDIQVQSDSSSNSLLGKGNTENSYNNNQLRQDYNQQGTSRPVEQGATSVEKQLSSAETMGDVDKIVENQLVNDVETSSMKWEDIANDADDLYRKIGQLAGDDNNLLALKQAFAADDVQTANMLVRKVMAATRVFGDLTQQAKEILREKGDPTEIYKALTYISQYIKDTASGFGGGLNAMKFKNKSLNFFSITTLEQQGMEHLAELLHKDFQGLNFTRPVEENLQELYKKISGYLEGKFWNNIMADADFAKALDNHLRRALANGDASEEALLNMVQNLARETVYRETENFLKKAVDLPSRLRWFQKGMDIAQASPTLYVSSILTSPLTHFRNGVSGAFMTLYKPLSKILGGAMALDTSMIKEGVYTYHYLFGTSQTIKEAVKIGLHTLKTGEGTLTGMGHTATDMTSRIETMFKFNELGNPNASIGQKMIDFLTFSSRLMGAEDEFITQLNYRAMSRAKALATAERQANALGLKGETRAKFLEERTDSLFQAAFDSRGRAVDTDLYASSREATFQGDLSGKYYDPFEGNKVQKKEVTVMMRVGAAAQDLIRKVPFLKYFQPFVRTPANIAQFGLEHNAIYAFCSPSQRRILFSKTREGAEARGKLAVGLLTFWGGLNLASQGLITGSAPPDTKTRERLLKTGWQPYSIHVGNKYISYKGLDPVESWLSFAADSFTAWNAFDPDSYQGSHMANWLYKQAQLMVTHALESTGFINSVSELNELFEMTEANDTEKVEKLLANKLRGMTPYSSLGNYIGHVNPLNPDKDAQRRPQGLKETYVNKFFLADGMGDYRRNYFGERLDLYYTMGLFPTSEEKTEIEDEEIQRLTEEGWQPSELSENYTTYGINFRDYKEQGGTTSLHDLMLETLSEITLEGKTLREAARELIQSEEYQELLDGIKIEEKGTNDTKINKLKALFKRYKDAAKEEVIKKYGDDYVNKEGISPKARVANIRTEQEARLREARLDDTIKELDDYWNN